VSASAAGAGRLDWRVLLLAFALRAALFPLAENKHGDAPMRALIAERTATDAAAAADPRAYCQFGPLHLALMRPFLALDDESPRSSRYLSFVAGLATFFPFFALATRLVGARAAGLATLALAVSPLHLQASTTAASEALYLLLFVAMLERLTRALEGDAAPLRDYALAGALASLAAVTRYDAWVSLPVAALVAWIFARGPQGPARARRARGLVVFGLAAAALPAAWVAWSAARTDDPIFFFHYIRNDHAQLAAAVLERHGAALGRARQLGIWALALAAAMGPLLALALARFRRAQPLSPVARVALAAALAPPALYLGQGLLRLAFEPLPRFALVPGAILLPFAAALVPQVREAAARVGVVVGAVAFAAIVWGVATVGRPRVWGGAESLGALTRLDAEDRALAAHLRARRAPGDRVMIQPFGYDEIAILAEARVPAALAITLSVTRTPGPTVAETRRTTGARWLAGRAEGADAWPRLLPDWPGDAVALGQWRLIGP
jgi:4-amino-4-deoxy-L-arabinose transferase-like glycosyltransferase